MTINCSSLLFLVASLNFFFDGKSGWRKESHVNKCQVNARTTLRSDEARPSQLNCLEQFHDAYFRAVILYFRFQITFKQGLKYAHTIDGKVNKSSYFRVKLKRIKFVLYTEPDLDLT